MKMSTIFNVLNFKYNLGDYRKLLKKYLKKPHILERNTRDMTLDVTNKDI